MTGRTKSFKLCFSSIGSKLGRLIQTNPFTIPCPDLSCQRSTFIVWSSSFVFKSFVQNLNYSIAGTRTFAIGPHVTFSSVPVPSTSPGCKGAHVWWARTIILEHKNKLTCLHFSSSWLAVYLHRIKSGITSFGRNDPVLATSRGSFASRMFCPPYLRSCCLSASSHIPRQTASITPAFTTQGRFQIISPATRSISPPNHLHEI